MRGCYRLSAWHTLMHQASLWGSSDGEGASLVYYFGLPEGWTPDQAPNKAALGLLRRFVHNGCASQKAVSVPNLHAQDTLAPVLCMYMVYSDVLPLAFDLSMLRC